VRRSRQDCKECGEAAKTARSAAEPPRPQGVRRSRQENLAQKTGLFLVESKRLERRDLFKITCPGNQQLLVFYQDFLDPKRPQLIAVGERFAGSPRELSSKDSRPGKGSNNQPGSTLSGSADVTD